MSLERYNCANVVNDKLSVFRILIMFYKVLQPKNTIDLLGVRLTSFKSTKPGENSTIWAVLKLAYEEVSCRRRVDWTEIGDSW